MERVEQYKYLGLTIDSQLTFQTHRDNLINNVNYKISFFKKIRKFVTTEAALIIYKGTILPILEYADFVFDYKIKYVSKRFQTIQNQGLYTVYNQHILPYDRKDPTETLHRKAKVARLEHRRKKHMLVFIYNYIHDETMVDNRNIHTRRHDGVLFKIPPYHHLT